LELSWVELQRLLEKVEQAVVEPRVILIKRQHLRDDKLGYDFNVKTHYRYSDKTILTASVAETANVKY
jgi:hypothetical protein